MKSHPILKPTSQEELLKGWLLHVHKERTRHNQAARRYLFYHRVLGALAAILSAAVGTSIFASVGQDSPTVIVSVLAGGASVLAAGVAALVTFLGLESLSARHQVAGARNKAEIRAIEALFATPNVGGGWSEDALRQLKQELDELERESPVVSEDIVQRVDKEFVISVFVANVEGLLKARSVSPKGKHHHA